MNIDPKIWGPKAWSFIYSIGYVYPESPSKLDMENYKSFFWSLRNVLPCSDCRNNYKKFLVECPPQLENRDCLLKWLVKLHNSTKKSSVIKLSMINNIIKMDELNLINKLIPLMLVFIFLLVIRCN